MSNISDRLFGDLEWPGRRVKSDDKSGASAEEDGGAGAGNQPNDAPSLLAEEEGPQVRDKIRSAKAAVQRLEDEARRQLRETGDVSIEGQPQTQEAVKMLAGTHPAFGTDLPEPEEGEKLDDGRISGKMIERAYYTMENPGRNGLGVKMEDVVMNPDGEVTTYNVTSPAQASGQADADTGTAGSINEALEQTEQKSQTSIWKKLAYAVGAFIVKFVGNLFKKIGEKIKNMFSITVVGVTINLAKPVSWAYLKVASLLFSISERLMERALGQDFTDEATPETEQVEQDLGQLENDLSDEVALGNAPDFESAVLGDEPQAAPSDRGAGTEFLSAAHRVLRTSANSARERDSPELARAMDLFDRARTLRRDVAVHDDVAVAWGAPTAPQDQAEEDPPEPGTEAAQVVRANEDPADFNC
jgi:hypothetical protein